MITTKIKKEANNRQTINKKKKIKMMTSLSQWCIFMMMMNWRKGKKNKCMETCI